MDATEFNVRKIPNKYKGLHIKARNGSRKAAIRMKCLECVGYSEKEVRECTEPECSLYRYRLSGGGGKNIRNTLIPQKEYKKWRNKILEKDNMRCRICKRKDVLEVHHIVYVADNADLIVNESNGVSLCKRCHQRIHAGTLKLDDSDWDNE